MIRVGMGFDVHRLVEGRDLWLGGVNIPWEKGLLGHVRNGRLVIPPISLRNQGQDRNTHGIDGAVDQPTDGGRGTYRRRSLLAQVSHHSSIHILQEDAHDFFHDGRNR